MQELFGPITGSTLVFVVTLLTQFVKQHFSFSARQVQLIALLFSIILVVPYHVITALMVQPDWAAVELAYMVFSAIVYGLLGWLAAIGAYEVIKPRG